jgi:hypothetical protein
MAARDRYTVDLECPQCGREGVAHVSEDDHPFMKSLRFSVDRVSEGFSDPTRGRTAAEYASAAIQRYYEEYCAELKDDSISIELESHTRLRKRLNNSLSKLVSAPASDVASRTRGLV